MNFKNLNTMKTTIKTIALLFVATMVLFFTSCDEEEFDKPVISDMEIGLSDSHIGYIGADLHMEGEIEAAGTLGDVLVEVYQDASSVTIDSTYTDYEGLKNSTFHKHLDIPDETTAGTYQLRITVYDQEGQYSTYEDEITIEESDDEEAPEISVSSFADSTKTLTTGDYITITGTVTDNISLGGIFIGLVYESDNIADSDVGGSNTYVIPVLHTHDFDDPDEYDFDASIEIGAEYDNNMTPALIEGDNAWKSGDYYILVKSKDANGNWGYSKHYPITISL